MIKLWLKSFWQPVQKKWQKWKKEKKTRTAIAKLFTLNANAKTSSINIWQGNVIMLCLYQHAYMVNWSDRCNSKINKRHAGGTIFPKIGGLLNILWIIPTERAETQRSFCFVRRIRTMLRSNMSIDRSGDLAIKLCMTTRLFFKEIYKKPVWVTIPGEC